MSNTLRLGPALPETIEIDTVVFGVPAQRFLVSAEIVRGRQLPVVQDFALRLLRVAGPMAAADLQAFFGWSGRELRELLGGLLRAELVVETDGKLALGPVGQLAFRDAPEGAGPPTAVRAELVAQTVALDMVSFNLTAIASRAASTRHLPTLQVSDRRRASDAVKAVPEALRANWREFIGEWLFRHPDEPDPELQAILEVEPKGHFISELVVPVTMSLEGEVRAEANLSSLELSGRQGSRRDLIAAATRQFAAIQAPNDHAAALALMAAYELPVLDRFGPHAPPGAWARYALSDPKFDEARRPSVAVCGSVVSPMVRAALLDRTAEWETGLGRGDEPILWIRPGVANWGLGAAYSGVFSALARRSRAAGGIVLVCRSGESRLALASRPDLLTDGGFSSVLEIAGSGLPAALEIVFKPGRWALLLIHRPVGTGSFPVGHGICSAAPSLVTGVSNLVREALRHGTGAIGRRVGDGASLDLKEAIEESIKASELPASSTG